MKSAAERISRLVRLTARERVVLLRAWWLLLVVDVALRVVPLTWLLPRDGVRRPRTPPPSPERIAWLLDVARRHSPARATCLSDALVLTRLLRAEGLEAVLNLGVARAGGPLRAHAWVESGGQILVGAVDGETYGRLIAAAAPPKGR